MKKKGLIPFEATHPGVILLRELKSRNIKQNELSMQLDVQPTFLNEIIKGKRSITADFALLLEKVLNIPADFWLKFQSQYDIDKAKIKEKNIVKLKLIETWNIIREYVPVNYFKQLGYLSDSLEQSIEQIMRIYCVESIDHLLTTVAEHNTLAKSYYRKSDKLPIDNVNMLAWSKLSEFEAMNKTVRKFHISKMADLKSELHNIFYKNKNVRELTKKKLDEYGIKLIYLKKFNKTPIDGYSFWSCDNPAIALTLRHKRIDNFAFTIMHELGHIELHLNNHKEKKYIDIYGLKRKNIEEEEADTYAQESLISEKIWDEFKNSDIQLGDLRVYEISKKHQINPAILFGRYCWENKFYAIKSSINKDLN